MNRIRDWRYVWQTRYSEDGRPSRVLVKQMRVPDSFLRSIVYLFYRREDAEQMRHPGGSGFIVEARPWREERGSKSARYVVTNGHVIGDGAYAVRLNAFQNGQPVVIEIPEDQWIRHPDGDLALAFLEYARGEGVYGYRTVADDLILGDDGIRVLDVGIGDQVFMLGLFAGYYGESANQVLPAARFGHVSMMPSQRVRRTLPGGVHIMEESYLVEMYSMGGFSGSPVFVRKLPWSPMSEERAFPPIRQMPPMRRMGMLSLRTLHGMQDAGLVRDEQLEDFVMSAASDRIYLLGINWGHLPQELQVRRKHSGDDANNGDYEELVAVSNHSIGCVVPARKLRELLEDPEVVEHRTLLMEEDKRKREQPSTETGGVPDALPFPDSGFTPGLQRTLKEKLERGEIDEVDEDAFLGSMRRAVPPEPPPERDDEAP